MGYLRLMKLQRGWAVLFLYGAMHTLNAQYDVFVQGFSGRMVSHSQYNASMAGPVAGFQVETHWLLRNQNGIPPQQIPAEEQSLRLVESRRQRFVGLGVNGFDMGDRYRREYWLQQLDSQGNRSETYAQGGRVFSAMMIFGEQRKLTARWKFRYQWATGFSYHTQYFSPTKNPLNLAISTPLNFSGQLRGSFLYDVSSKITLSLGGNITHFSNANWRKPNVGYNNFHGNVGVWIRTSTYQKRHPSGRLMHLETATSTQDRCHWNTAYNALIGSKYQFGLRFGRRMESLKQPGFFSVMVIEVNRGVKLSGVNGVARHEWRMGLNAFYEGKFDYIDTFQGGNGRSIAVGARKELGLFGRHVFRMGRLDVNLDLGCYLHHPRPNKTQFYNCLGFQYHLSERLIFQQRLKAHLNVADYLEWGLLYAF